MECVVEGGFRPGACGRSDLGHRTELLERADEEAERHDREAHEEYRRGNRGIPIVTTQQIPWVLWDVVLVVHR